jgi:His/Glu/Gln/Arg/opine family amino acid ABC transporter permease subunit
MLSGYLPILLTGLILTLKVAIVALILGMILGLIGASAEASKVNWLRYLFIGYHSVIRGLPELLILFFIYFGGSEILNKIFRYSAGVSSFVAGVIGLAMIFGAYASQTFRGAFLAIPKGQTEAAKALGLDRWQRFRLILLPQAWRHALPGLSNLWLVLLKDTALVSLIGLADLMMQAQAAAVSTAKPFTFYFAAAVIYLILTSISEVILRFFSLRANRYLKV